MAWVDMNDLGEHQCQDMIERLYFYASINLSRFFLKHYEEYNQWKPRHFKIPRAYVASSRDVSNKWKHGIDFYYFRQFGRRI